MSQFQGIEVPPDVIRAARSGDARAYEAIYRACQRPVYTLIRRIVVRPAIADELLQETFVEILRNIDRFTGEGAFGGWVRAIAVNKSLMHLRSSWHRRVDLLDAGEDSSISGTLSDPGPPPDVRIEASDAVEFALTSLPAVSRTVVWLHDVEGCTHGEIARALGKTVSFSKSQLARAHVRLRELLTSSLESPSCTRVSRNY